VLSSARVRRGGQLLAVVSTDWASGPILRDSWQRRTILSQFNADRRDNRAGR
jgi:hypothetical protein